MRRGAAAALLLAVVLALAGCGSDDGPSAQAAFPTTAPVQGAVLSATLEDPAGDAGDPVVDLRRARIEQRGTSLEVHVVLNRPLPPPTDQETSIQVGAYLLRGPDDLEPVAARLVRGGKRPQAFRWGPWLEPGAPAAGQVDGAEVTVTVTGVPTGRYRYVQFFAEADGGGDVAPDDTPDGAGVVAIDPEG